MVETGPLDIRPALSRVTIEKQSKKCIQYEIF